MKEMIEFIARSLVEDPERVSVREHQTGEQVVYELSVAANDVGRVIGKRGRIAKAIRTIAAAASREENKRVRVEVAPSETREDA